MAALGSRADAFDSEPYYQDIKGNAGSARSSSRPMKRSGYTFDPLVMRPKGMNITPLTSTGVEARASLRTSPSIGPEGRLSSRHQRHGLLSDEPLSSSSAIPTLGPSRAAGKLPTRNAFIRFQTGQEQQRFPKYASRYGSGLDAIANRTSTSGALVTVDDFLRLAGREELNWTQIAAAPEGDDNRSWPLSDRSEQKSLHDELAGRQGLVQDSSAVTKAAASNSPTFTMPDTPVQALLSWLYGESASDSVGAYHRKQDYEMQMVLLEQQNKKRLLMARMEQDSMANPAMPPPQRSREISGNSPTPPHMLPSSTLDVDGFGSLDLDFGSLEGGDVLDNFDFDSFLNTSGNDTRLNIYGSSLFGDGGLENVMEGVKAGSSSIPETRLLDERASQVSGHHPLHGTFSQLSSPQIVLVNQTISRNETSGIAAKELAMMCILGSGK